MNGIALRVVNTQIDPEIGCFVQHFQLSFIRSQSAMFDLALKLALKNLCIPERPERSQGFHVGVLGPAVRIHCSHDTSCAPGRNAENYAVDFDEEPVVLFERSTVVWNETLSNF